MSHSNAQLGRRGAFSINSLCELPKWVTALQPLLVCLLIISFTINHQTLRLCLDLKQNLSKKDKFDLETMAPVRSNPVGRGSSDIWKKFLCQNLLLINLRELKPLATSPPTGKIGSLPYIQNFNVSNAAAQMYLLQALGGLDSLGQNIFSLCKALRNSSRIQVVSLIILINIQVFFTSLPKYKLFLERYQCYYGIEPDSERSLVIRRNR